MILFLGARSMWGKTWREGTRRKTNEMVSLVKRTDSVISSNMFATATSTK